MINNKTYYPTPTKIIRQMFNKIQNKNNNLRILEPSAGKGNIVDFIKESQVYNHYKYTIDTIEKDLTLQAALIGKGANVIDSDFLLFDGPDKYDVIIANPPFNEGDLHLLKAIDIMYHGEIICLLNAETLKNPHTNSRKLLLRKLEELNADIEYIQNGFINAERKTNVEIAIVYINIKREIEADLFDGCTQNGKDTTKTIKTDQEIQTLNSIKNMVDDYNRVVKIGTETLLNYYKNYNHIAGYISLNEEENRYSDDNTLTAKMQSSLNLFLKNLRIKYWGNVLQLKPIRSRLTKAKAEIFYQQKEKQSYMDFTEYNIRTFILNIINTFEQTLTDAVVSLFDTMTQKYKWENDNIHEKNVHYFNGWKTNKAFFVNKKVILPYFSFWDNNYGNARWKISWQKEAELRDIDLIMNYFDGMSGNYYSIQNALEKAFSEGQTKNIKSTYFTITVFKKGTMHLTFNDENIRRRFNITACKGKQWLKQDYGVKPFKELSYEDQITVESFEDKKTYDTNLNNCSFAIPNLSLKLLAA